jgi:hypothetical protein
MFDVHLFKALSVRKNAARRIVYILLVVFLSVGVFAVLFEERLIYFPEKYPGGMWDVQKLPAAEGKIVPKIEEYWLSAEDGVKLHGWFCTPGRIKDGSFTPIKADMVLLFFHGNAGNITYRYDMIRVLMTLPVKVFIIDYRGYGKSEGRPSENGLYLDARAAWDYLIHKLGISPEHVVIFGKSLGGAVAVDLATRVRSAGLIVQSSFTSVPDMARSILPIFPPFLLRTKMDSISKIPMVNCPKLFIHSPADEIVPYRLGRRLFEAASEPKQFFEVQGAPHNETYLVGGEAYLDAVRDFVVNVHRKDAASGP